MEICNRDDCEPFLTKDTSEIREILAYRNSACERTSLAEATIYPGACTEAHYHPKTEEIYYVLSGTGRIRVDDEERDIGPGDAILLRGAVDALLVDEDGLEVIDYKTDRVSGGALRAKYEAQLGAYVEGVARTLGIAPARVSARLVYLRTGEVVGVGG